MPIIAFDSHKHYTQVCVENDSGDRLTEGRIGHKQGVFRAFLSGYQPGCPVTVETIGNWYWIVDEIEQAGVIVLPLSPTLASMRTCQHS
jgi:hypothetical protein